jgi:GxxExxY protein
MNDDGRSVNGLTERIIGAGFEVSNTLGAGFVENIYENALARELRLRGLSVAQQNGVSVYYKDFDIGTYVTDLIVEDTVIVELKVVQALNEFHIAQCVNYLRATGKTTCLLMNFAKPRLEYRRIVL